MAITRNVYGTLPDGTVVERLTITNADGDSASFITYGATLTSLVYCGVDTVLGYTDWDGYVHDTASLGVTVGRYANRIAGGTFVLNGVTYDVGRNEQAREGHLHGGAVGFQKKNWTVTACEDNAFTLSLHSPDGDMGYPGALDVSLRVAFDDTATLSLTYTATADRDTVINLTNHSYFNLNGSGSVLDTVLYINADAIVPVNERLIPVGELLPVDGTPFDFRTAKPIGRDIDGSHPQLTIGGGYDHSFVLNNGDVAARAFCPQSGITLCCTTTEPAVQLYTANFLETDGGKHGRMTPRTAFCLETQHAPDSPNQPQFPSTVLRAGDTFRSVTVYSFTKS